MKRRDLIAYLEEQGCILIREGGRHSIYQNPANKQSAPVPRHKEISDLLARKILRQLAFLHLSESPLGLNRPPFGKAVSYDKWTRQSG